ncbi:MAG TPA: FAD-dependent monooxygenase [Pyrinomonadaceae bacterium]|jgi:2-polyprenyl-6-methoxyphenol hydroxylase-like FAD-dependent oxidoreductase
MAGVRRVAIVGGGIGGLCAAIALRRAGVETSVYEQAEKLREVGAGITLWPNAVGVLRRLGLAEGLIRRGARMRRAAILTSAGRVLAESRPEELERLTGEPTVALHRADLHALLLAALPEDFVRLGAKFVAAEETPEGVTARFADGRAETADLLVGADGLNSAVRRQLFPAVQPRYSGYTSWRGIAPQCEGVAEGFTSESLGRGSRFGIVPIGRGRVYWYATENVPAGQAQPQGERKGHLLRRFEGWHEPVKRLIEVTPDEHVLRNDIYDIEPMRSWHAGRVVLLGDAAHPTTPNMGQGACMAIESAFTLARSISEAVEVEGALGTYERARMKRTAWVTRQSRMAGRVGQVEGRVACAARDLLLAAAPKALMRRTLERAVSFEL